MSHKRDHRKKEIAHLRGLMNQVPQKIKVVNQSFLHNNVAKVSLTKSNIIYYN